MHHPKSKKAHVGITKKGKPKCALKTRRGKNGCFIVEVVGDAETEEAVMLPLCKIEPYHR